MTGGMKRPNKPSTMGAGVGFAPRLLRDRTPFATLLADLVIVRGPLPPATVGRPMPNRSWASRAFLVRVIGPGWRLDGTSDSGLTLRWVSSSSVSECTIIVLVECKRDRVEGCRTMPRVEGGLWREVRRGDCELKDGLSHREGREGK